MRTDWRRSCTRDAARGGLCRRGASLSLLTLGPLLALVAACGKSGPPLAPLRLMPEAPTELRLAERGDRIELTCRAPRASVDGARLGLLELQLFTSMTEGDPIKTSAPRLHRVAPGEAFSETMQPVPAAGTTLRVVARARLGKRMSAVTPVATLTVQTPPLPPPQLRVERAAAGVQLHWKPAPEAAGGAVRYWVYRRPDSGAYGAALNAEPTSDPSFLDADAEASASVCYVVRSIVSVDPVIESVSSTERCLAARPPARPATPRGLLAVPDGGAVQLSWTCSAEPVVVAYRVYRAEGQEQPQPRAKVEAGRCSFRDENLPSGAVLKYSLTAVDGSGNESAPALFGTLRPRGQ
jgi:hypothetical protein